MRSKDIFLTLFIIMIFLGLYLFNVFVIQFANIQENWPTYRCNPTVMPFSSSFGVDPGENFTYCIQNMQSNYMSYLLEPITASMSLISSLGGDITESINTTRGMISYIRTSITDIIQSVFGVFLNMLIEIQKIVISLKDLVGKNIGIIVTLLYTIDGVTKTMESAWNSPAGDVMRSLADIEIPKIKLPNIKEIKRKLTKKLKKKFKKKFCFHPDTLVKVIVNDYTLQYKKMKDLELGDIIENGSEVEGVLNLKNWVGIDNNDNNDNNESFKQCEKLYKIPNMDGSCIYVTGSHLILYKQSWIYVKDHPERCSTSLTTKTLSCIITSDHLVHIGSHTFHDWEDENIIPIIPMSPH